MPADIVAEATYTNPTDGEPALSHVRWALESGKHVCTTNKGPVALAGRALKALAAEHGVSFEFEGSVLSGTPILRTAQRMFGGLQITGVQGIMNGTSNYILGRLEEGIDLPAAIAEAQELGYAEADPTADIEGHDVRLKVIILANEVLGADAAPRGRLRARASPASHPKRCRTPRPRDCAGSWSARRPDARTAAWTPRWRPQALPAHHPLAGISGAGNAVAFDTDLLGTVTVSGPGAGRIETAYALLSDIIAIHERHHGRRQPPPRAASSPGDLP